MSVSRAVLWDMDGTLIDSEEFHWISWRNALAKEGIALTHEQFLSTFGTRNDSILRRLLGSAATPERMERIADAKEELYRGLIRRNGILPLPELSIGCAAFIRRDGFRQLHRRRRVRTSMPSLRPSRQPIFFKASSPLKMCAEVNPTPRSI